MTGKFAARKGAIAWMTQNPVASNLLMLMLLLGGALAALSIKQEVFPQFDLDFVVISVPYPGATPEASEEIVTSIEQAVGEVDGVKRINASASEGAGSVFIELLTGTDANKALNDVKSAVDRITTFPRDAEEPVINLFSNRREVITLVFHGNAAKNPVQNEKILREFAERARDRLKALPDITYVELSGVRPVEMHIDVSEQRLRQHRLTPGDIAQRIAAEATEIPAGGLDTATGEVLVRTRPRPTKAEEFRDLTVLTSGDGSRLTVDDLGDVRDGFADTDLSASYNGEPAIMLKVYRVADETPVAVADAVKTYMAEAEKQLPAGVNVATWIDWSEMYEQRLELMVRNALLGFLLVLLILGLFLEIRLAFWVTLGIPISFLGSMLLMPAMDVTINMISLFAFIVTLGMVVDDAIVVGENVFEKRQRGMPWMKAAIAGAREVARPVTFSILTTVVAFMPMFFVPGASGKFFRVIPAIVISVLIISLVESFFVLPAHLGHEVRQRSLRLRLTLWAMAFMALGVVASLFSPGLMIWQGLLGGAALGVVMPFLLALVGKGFTFMRLLAAPGLAFVIDRMYRPSLAFALRQRYLTMAFSGALFVFAIGLVAGERVKFTFMPAVESDIISAEATLPFGAPVSETTIVRDHIVAAARKVLADNGGEEKLSRGIFAAVGQGVPGTGPIALKGASGGHVAMAQVLLVPSGDRAISATEFVRQWREAVGQVANLDKLNFRDSIGPGAGSPIDVKLVHTDMAVLERAAKELAVALEGFKGVKDIDPGFQRGKPQLELSLTPLGKSLGITEGDLGRQLRGRLFGAEALRQQRGRDEMRVMVRLPEDERVSEATLARLRIMTPRGELPLAAVADVERSYGFTSIKRSDEQRAINVTADIDRTVTTPEQVFGRLLGKDGTLPTLMKKYAGLTFDFDGERRERMESMSALGTGSLFALLIIYALLAIPFRSYLQPLVVMSAIPLGMAAAIFGHVLMGYDLSLISIMGIIALSGVVINDSLVLIDAANRAHREGGLSPWRAINWAGRRRFRPILLTSLTTFFGLAPMIFETSVQARFLIPMAISLGFGILIATFFILITVPAVYLVIEDVKRLFGFAGPLHQSREGANDDDDGWDEDMDLSEVEEASDRSEPPPLGAAPLGQPV